MNGQPKNQPRRFKPCAAVDVAGNPRKFHHWVRPTWAVEGKPVYCRHCGLQKCEAATGHDAMQRAVIEAVLGAGVGESMPAVDKAGIVAALAQVLQPNEADPLNVHGKWWGR